MWLLMERRDEQNINAPYLLFLILIDIKLRMCQQNTKREWH